MERAFNARTTLDTLQERRRVVRGSVRGRRKAILFVSEGIDYDIYDVIAQTTRTITAPRWSSTRRARRSARRRAQRRASTASIRAGLTDLGDESIEVGSFPDDTSLGVGPGSLQNELRLSQDSLRDAVGRNRRLRGRQQNDFATAFDRIVADNSSYYVLAYYPPDAQAGRSSTRSTSASTPARADRPRAPGLRHAEEGSDAARSRSDRNEARRRRKLREALDSPLPVSGLTMHVFAAPFKGTAPNASVLFGVELRGRDLKLDAEREDPALLPRHRRQRQGFAAATPTR